MTAITTPAGWLPMDTAPKDVPILAICHHASDPGFETVVGHEFNIARGTLLGKPPTCRQLTTYAAHYEGLTHVEDGPHVIVWGGGFSDSPEDGGGWLPDWWFRFGSEFEEAAFPIGWLPIPVTELPKEGYQ